MLSWRRADVGNSVIYKSRSNSEVNPIHCFTVRAHNVASKAYLRDQEAQERKITCQRSQAAQHSLRLIRPRVRYLIKIGIQSSLTSSKMNKSLTT